MGRRFKYQEFMRDRYVYLTYKSKSQCIMLSFYGKLTLAMVVWEERILIKKILP